MYGIIEFGTGPRGEDDDRPLGKNGRFLEGYYDHSEVAAFETEILAAQGAAGAFSERSTGHVGMVRL